MEETVKIKPPLKIKLLFWLILAMYSTTFAEVVAGSDMFALFNPWGILVELPLYGLHTLVLAYVVFNYSKPRLYTLYSAGIIFGMYEAYITKVVWDPPWGKPLLNIGGVSAVDFSILAFFWHPFMAFILPLFLTETLLTRSRTVAGGLPDWFRNIFKPEKKRIALLFLFVFMQGAVTGINSRSIWHSLLSCTSGMGLLMFVAYLWRKKTNGLNYGIKELLPQKKGFVIILSVLLLIYVFLGATQRMSSLPGFYPQLTIWAIYAAAFTLFYFSMKKSRLIELNEPPYTEVKFPSLLMVMLPLLFSFASACRFLFGFNGMITFVLIYWTGMMFAYYMLFRTVRDTFTHS